MNAHLLSTILQRFRKDFLTHFSALTSQDILIIRAGPSEMLLIILQTRYGYTRTQAKAAWNDFILRSVDGHTTTNPIDFITPTRLLA